MVSQKIILSLTVAAIVIAITQVSSSPQPQDFYAADDTNESHDLIIGCRMPGDKLRSVERLVNKNSAWMEVTIVEKTFYAPHGEKITLFKALDQETNGNGGYARLVNGGPGSNNVTINFKSQRGYGINFIVELYAR